MIVCCSMMNVQSLTLESWFHVHLLKKESFSALVGNLSLMRVLITIICDITASMERSWVQYAT